MNRIHDDDIPLAPLLEETTDPSAGALVVFGGTVRNHDGGRSVARLAYSAYRPVAERLMDEIERETRERFGVTSCRIAHRVGDLDIGDVAVWVVVRGAHRDEAFRAARWAIDEVKSRVPIWKEEHFTDGTRHWVEGCRHDATPVEPETEAPRSRRA